MGNINALLAERLKKENPSSKMSAMAKQSANGHLTSFSGIFSITELSDLEKAALNHLLEEHSTGEQNVEKDLPLLASITSEVKAINNQAAMLHGERIKKAHDILTKYRDGAFTAWLLATYGNRQTPYNFMQYYELCEALPKNLRPKIESIPRQAIYTLATREGPLDKKRDIIQNYKGETKEQMLVIIREYFPLKETDRRRGNSGDSAIHHLEKVAHQLKSPRLRLTKLQKKSIVKLIDEIQQLVEQNCG